MQNHAPSAFECVFALLDLGESIFHFSFLTRKVIMAGL